MTCIYANGQKSKSDTLLRSSVRLSFLNFVDNTFFVGYEYLFQKGNGLYAGLGSVYADNNDGYKSGLRTEVQFKLYITKKWNERVNKRIYFAPYFTYKYIETGPNNYTGESFAPINVSINYYNSFCPGIIAGYNIAFLNKLSIDFFIGGGLKRTFDGDFKGHINSDNYNIMDPGYSGVIPKIGIEAGINF